MNSDLTILVVEDEPLVLSGTVRRLRNAGYRVLEAETGEAALEIANTHLPDLILLDVVLPDIDGMEICRRLKRQQRTAHIFICVLSAKRVQSTQRSEGLDTGADEYLTRPIGNRELLERVQAMTRLILAERALSQHRNQLAEQVEAQLAQLRMEETKFRLSFDNAAVGMAIVDRHSSFLSVNRSTCLLMGRTEAEMLRSSLFAVTAEADAGTSASHFERCLTDGEPFELALTYAVKDGQTRHALTSVSPVFTNAGAFQFAIVHLLDLTDRKQAEERCRYLFNAIPDDAFVLDRQWRYLYANKGVAEKLGRPPEALMGRRITELYPQITTSPFWPALESTMTEAAPTRTVAEFSFVSGQSGWYEIRAIPVTEGILIVSRDITEGKKLEDQLRQTQKMESIGNLAGGIAHDFNNILYAITGMAELLMDDLQPGSDTHDNAAEILKAAQRGSDLVKQILAVSRQVTHEMMPVRAQSILADVLKLARAAIPADIDIAHDLDMGYGNLKVDADQIHQAVMNIITNASQAVASTGGRVEVGLRETALGAAAAKERGLRPGRYALIWVSDNGQGMTAETMAHIFDPYFTTKAQGKGTGLGLAVAYGIVKEHQGEIQVRSKLGHGTTFEIYLPLMESSVGGGAHESKQRLPTGAERILLVDDEAPIAKMEDLVLTRLGYRVTACTSSVGALAAFEADPAAFDLILTDMTMPRMTGDQLAQRARAVRPDIPVIICTGFSEKMDSRKAGAMGINCFLMKPVSKATLAETVRCVLDNAAAAAAEGGRGR